MELVIDGSHDQPPRIIPLIPSMMSIVVQSAGAYLVMMLLLMEGYAMCNNANTNKQTNMTKPNEQPQWTGVFGTLVFSEDNSHGAYPFPAGSLKGKIVMVRRGKVTFDTKTQNVVVPPLPLAFKALVFSHSLLLCECVWLRLSPRPIYLFPLAIFISRVSPSIFLLLCL